MVGHVDPDTLLNQAHLALKKGDLLGAEQIYTGLIDMYPDSEQAKAAHAALDQLRPKQREDKSSEAPFSTLMLILAGLGFWVLIGLSIGYFFSESAKNILGNYWWMIGLGIIALAIFGIIVQKYEGRSAQSYAEGRRRILTAFILVPFLLMVLMAVVVFTAREQAFMLEMVFIVVVSIIPAAAYYLFLVTRRPSIFNEFISNLSRLGLLDRRPIRRYREQDLKNWNERVRGPVDAESDNERIARLESYFQRFEAGYGRLRFVMDDSKEYTRPDFIRFLTCSVDSGSDRSIELNSIPQASIHIADMLRANLVIPLGLSTALTVVGWLLVMQPEWTAISFSLFVDEQVDSSAVQKDASSPSISNKGVEAAPAPSPVLGTDFQTKASGDFDHLIVRITPEWTPVNFAFLGAYFFGMQMLFRRFVRRDLGSNAYLAFAHRIVLAVIGVWVAIAAYEVLIASIDGPTDKSLKHLLLAPVTEEEDWPAFLLILAFVIGVFPRVLWQVIQTVLAKITLLRLAVPGIESKQPLSDLDGLTVWHEARLEEEDVENVPNMATVDLVDIMLHTQIPAERLVAWVDQAILYSALGPNNTAEGGSSLRSELRDMGLRCATQVVVVSTGDGTATSKEETALRATVDGDDQEGRLDVLVHALQVDTNFDLVRAWRRV